MKLYTHPVIYGVAESGIQVVSDFMIPYVRIQNDSARPVLLTSLSFSVTDAHGEIHHRIIDGDTLPARFHCAIQEWRLYRQATWERTLGLQEVFSLEALSVSNLLLPGQSALLHQEFFRVHAPLPAQAVCICLRWDQGILEQKLTVDLSAQKNSYRFPISRPCFVTGGYIDPDAHRWCRNSEFALDIGLPGPTGMLELNRILGEPVYAAAAGTVLKAVDGVSPQEHDPELLEEKYGNDVRIDGNHVILAHPHGECSLYAHLHGLAKPWKVGDAVQQGQLLGYVGSTGNSACPHLHFHVFRKEDAFGPSIPIAFSNLLDIYDSPLDHPIRDDSLVFPQSES